MYLQRPDDAPIHIQNPDEKCEFVLWLKTYTKQERSQLCCDTILERKLPPDVQGMFDLLAKRFLPQEDPPSITLPHPISFDEVIDADGRIPGSWNIPLKFFPKKFQTMQREVSRELTELTKNFVKTVRWIQKTSGKQSPFAHVSFEWSNDKSAWRPMPSDIGLRVLYSKGIDQRSEAIERLRAVWANNKIEPLAHELLRESLDIADANPRSALLIGVSAFETGLKHYIQNKVPNSEVIIKKLPSPSVLTIIREIIPELHKRLKEQHQGFPLSDQEIGLIKKWIAKRNEVAHGRESKVDVDDLLLFLNFIWRMLYRLDVCRGHEWAKRFAFEEEKETFKFE
jgi:hypothetical protein